MSEKKHTPGPWIAMSYAGCHTIAAVDGRYVAEIEQRAYGRDSAADAHLIAAAPDMLEALEAVHSDINIRYLCGDDIADKVLAAIKKARGEK